MERKEVRDGEGGLTGGNAQVSLRFLLLLFIFFDTNSPFRSAGKVIITITDSCTYLFTLFNYLYFDSNLSPILSTVASRELLHHVHCRALLLTELIVRRRFSPNILVIIANGRSS